MLPEVRFGQPIRGTTAKNAETWIKIGESSNRENWFSVSWDTTGLENGAYQIRGVMHVVIKDGDREQIVCRENIVDVMVENPA